MKRPLLGIFAFQWVIGDLFGVSEFDAYTVIHKVSRAIVKQKGQFLSFPENLADANGKLDVVAHFPGVIGVIDFTHIRIIIYYAMAFVNRKQFYYINAQAICDSDAFITNIVPCWPGSTHDSHFWEQQHCRQIKR